MPCLSDDSFLSAPSFKNVTAYQLTNTVSETGKNSQSRHPVVEQRTMAVKDLTLSLPFASLTI